MVDFDSTIHPGREGKVTQRVKIEGLSGTVTKSVTVNSNAENNPSLRLTVLVEVEPVIGMELGFVSLTAAEISNPLQTTLNTRKKDLAITSVTFQKRSAGNGSSGWQDAIPVAIKFALSPGVLQKDGRYQYTLKLYGVASQDSEHGQFQIKTNHPKKRTVELRGMLGK